MFTSSSARHVCIPSNASPITDEVPTPIDYRIAVDACTVLASWAFDIARSRAPEPDDQDAIDRVEIYAHSLLAGASPRDASGFAPSQSDQLITLAALIDAFSLDFAGPGLPALVGQAYAGLDWITRSTPKPAPRRNPSLKSIGAWVAEALETFGAFARTAPRVVYGVDDAAANSNAAGRAPHARVVAR